MKVTLRASMLKNITRIRCNLCGSVFRGVPRLQRFCKHCREESELFRFAEWMVG